MKEDQQKIFDPIEYKTPEQIIKQFGNTIVIDLSTEDKSFIYANWIRVKDEFNNDWNTK